MAGRPGGAAAWSIGPDGVLLSVRLTPRSARDSLDGIELRADGRAVLKARVRAVPEAGNANAALTRLVADALDVAAACVTIESGAGGRLKVLRIAGNCEALARRLGDLAAAAKG